MQLARELTGISYPRLGKKFGGRDHSTIHSAQARAHNLIDAIPAYFDKREAVLARLNIA